MLKCEEIIKGIIRKMANAHVICLKGFLLLGGHFFTAKCAIFIEKCSNFYPEVFNFLPLVPSIYGKVMGSNSMDKGPTQRDMVSFLTDIKGSI